MTPGLETRLQEALSETPLAARLETNAAPLLERHGKDPCVDALEGHQLLGLARVVASSAEAARYLSRRPALLQEVARLGPDTLERRGAALVTRPAPDPGGDLEEFLDALRLMRRDEMLLAGCCQLGEIAPFSQVSLYLSIVAETCVRWALEGADAKGTSGLSVIGMGKIAGRELTYHSDLDVIFLYPDEVEDVMRPSRTAQRVISYLNTMTAAGVAYAVDSRLRPSGRQGALVSTFAAYERYQTNRAALWEHLALMRARAIAGNLSAAQSVLDRTRAALLRAAEAPWEEVAIMRRRVEAERPATAGGERVAFKTGVGGLMDVEFLATGALLETREQLGGDALPAIPTMLRAVAGARMALLLEDYAFLRRVEACARWVAGRPVEDLDLASENAAIVAELVEPGLDVAGLAKRIRGVCARNREAFETVIERRTVRALEDSG